MYMCECTFLIILTCTCFESYFSMRAYVLSCIWLSVTPWTVARQAPLCLWDSPGKNTGVGCHFFLQRIFLTQGSNSHLLCLLLIRWILYRWATWEACWIVPQVNQVNVEVWGLPWWLRRSSVCLAMPETQVQSLGWEHPLEKEMATHSSILAWKIPWTEESGSLQPMGLQRIRHDWVTFTFLSLLYIS